MGASTSSRTGDRYSRHVRRARLSVAPGAPAYRLASTLEEALRLASLPGENEGRAYYFRHLQIAGLPVDGDRRIWMERFQRMLTERAADAIHGGDARAGSAFAVFFHGEQEALEILLDRVLERRTAAEWFWPMIAGELAAAPGANLVVEIVERLRAREASWVAVAAAIFAAPKFDAVRLLVAIPPAVAERWLREMGTQAPVALPERTPAATRPVREAIEQAMRAFGAEDARTVWLATMAVLLESPAELAAGTAVARGRILLHIAAAPADVDASRSVKASPMRDVSQVEEEEAPEWRERDRPRVARAPESEAAEAEGTTPIADTEAAKTAGKSAPRVPALEESARDAVKNTAALHQEAPHETVHEVPRQGAHEHATRLLAWRCVGAPTSAAGLFFVLNAMRELGIVRALEDGLASLAPDFACRVLHRLALHAGVEADDPVRMWLESVIARDASPEQAAIDRAVRVWSVNVRRWCWRASARPGRSARLSVRDIVLRGGIFSVNRTDLDVSLPLDEADVRVRLIGLDLDPGWLPWFGRVVRFHYLYRGELHG